MPKGWAPSSTEMRPFSRAKAQISFTGSTCPVVHGMCGTAMTFVLGEMDRAMRLRHSSGVEPIGTAVTRMPSSWARRIQAAQPPMCSCWVMRTSSPDLRGMPQAIWLMPSLTFLVMPISSGRQPNSVASWVSSWLL